MIEFTNKKKRKKKINKESNNIIRTIQRNNVQLIHIADNKAAVLLSLNAIILTLLIPNMISNIDFILDNLLYVPLIILAATSLGTLCISSFVLIPPKAQNPNNVKGNHHTKNPFFFGNVYKMEPDVFYDKLGKTFDSQENIQEFLAKDLYYSGKRLGYKMRLIRLAFFIFLIGISLAVGTIFIASFI